MPVRIERQDTIAVIVLDDPDRRNAMTEALAAEFAAGIGELSVDPTVRAVVVTGAPPAFSAGGDLDMLEAHARGARENDLDTVTLMRRFYDDFLSVRGLPVPVVAAINGHAIGAGLCVALACDLRVVASDAKLGLPFGRLGLYPGMGATWMLPRAIGTMHAARLLYTGESIDGVEATTLGLCLRHLPAADVLDDALTLADAISQASPLVVRQLKARLADAATATLEATLEAEARAQAVGYRSDDLREGLAAARERRQPTFEGR